eukprot:1136362-Pelagomonas_calceolata.AAC.7
MPEGRAADLQCVAAAAAAGRCGNRQGKEHKHEHHIVVPKLACMPEGRAADLRWVAAAAAAAAAGRCENRQG